MSPVQGTPAEDSGLNAYAVPSQVYALNSGRRYSATSKPSTYEVERYLVETAGVINGILAEKSYVVPVATGASGARVTLEHFNALGAAKMVEDAAPTSDRRKEATEMWMWAQEMLRSGGVEFPDAAINSNHDQPRSSAPATAMFTRDMEF